MKSLIIRLSLIVIVLLAGSTALAQDDAPVTPVRGAINIIVPEVYSTAADGTETRLIAPSIFDPGDTLRTDAEGVALITWFYDGTETVLGQNSSLTLNSFSGEPDADFTIEIELHEGYLVTGLGGVAADLAQNASWTLVTPAFSVRLLRGQFEITVGTDGATELMVTEGRVEVLVGDAAPFPLDQNQYLVGAPGTAEVISTDGVTPELPGVCTASAPTNLNVRLAPNEDSRRLGGVMAGQTLWVRSATEGRLWLQVYFQTEPTDEEAHNLGWVYGPAVELDPDTCATLLRAPLDAHLYGGPGIDKSPGAAGESEPVE